jgi:MFS family permease
MQTATASAKSGVLWRNRAFTVFWLGQSLSLLGSGMAFVAFPLLVFTLTHSVQRMGQVTALMGVGSLIAGLVAGVLADHVDRRRMLLACDTCSAILFGAIPLWWWLFGHQVLLPFFFAAPLGFLSIAATVASTASIPRLVEPHQLEEANARMQSSTAISLVIGPILAGALIGLVGEPIILALNAVSYLISVGSLLLIRLRQPPAEGSAGPETGMLGHWLAGVRFLLRHPRLGWVAALRIGEWMLLAGVFDLLAFRVKSELHQGSAAVGVLWGLGTLGAIAGSLLAPRLRRSLGFGFVFLTGLALQAISLAAIGFLTFLPLFALCGIGVTFGDIGINILGASLLQAQTPDGVQGRVTAVVQTGMWGGAALGAAATTTLAAWAGSTPPAFWLIGGLMGGLAVLGLFTPVRKPMRDQSGA